MRLVLDVENSVTWKEGKIYNDPFEPGNTLTQIGMVNADDHTELHVVNLRSCRGQGYIRRWA